jgi:branched-chain amino acid transport system ATP-binding protein
LAAETIIALERVSKRFGSVRAVTDVSFDVPRGRCLGWLGPNGSGKTTLIRCMLGLARVSEGTIHVRGRRIPEESRSSTRTCRGVGTSRSGRASTEGMLTTGSTGRWAAST